MEQENRRNTEGKKPSNVSFYTPQIWAHKSRTHLARFFGENWQDEYYVWDCAAGTGGLALGLSNPNNVWVSTSNEKRAEFIRRRAKNGSAILEDRIFQFDFLNEDFSKLPAPLRGIVKDEEKRKKLIIYTNRFVVINENSDAKTPVFTFLKRVYNELYGCKIAEYSKIQIMHADYDSDVKKRFRTKLEYLFIVPSYAFYTDSEEYPIAFYIWDTDKDERFTGFLADVYRIDGGLYPKKYIYPYDKARSIGKWIKKYRDESGGLKIGALNYLYDTLTSSNRVFFNQNMTESEGRLIVTQHNLIPACVFFAVRHSINPYWLNRYDLFVSPDGKWEDDLEFAGDCLTYSIFNPQNFISVKYGINYWIPFSEEEVGARGTFYKDFMRNFFAGKIKNLEAGGPQSQNAKTSYEVSVSPQARAVLDAGRELFRYYHSQPDADINAAFQDIREYFREIGEDGRINPVGKDAKYSELFINLFKELKLLSKRIVPKIYEYGFFRE